MTYDGQRPGESASQAAEVEPDWPGSYVAESPAKPEQAPGFSFTNQLPPIAADDAVEELIFERPPSAASKSQYEDSSADSHPGNDGSAGRGAAPAAGSATQQHDPAEGPMQDEWTEQHSLEEPGALLLNALSLSPLGSASQLISEAPPERISKPQSREEQGQSAAREEHAVHSLPSVQQPQQPDEDSGANGLFSSQFMSVRVL